MTQADKRLPGLRRDKVSAWLSENVSGAEHPFEFYLIAGGRSNLTYRVEDAARNVYVLRRPPTGHVLATAHDMWREFQVLSAVESANIPVPTTLGLCTDDSVNDAPFYVMGFVEGWILRNETEATAALDIAGCQQAGESLVETLAQIHAVDVDAVGLGGLGRRDGYVGRQLKRWHTQYRSSRDQGGPTVDLIEAVHDQLVRTIPAEGLPCLVHGDYRLDNTVIGPDHRVAAVLDWELCTLGTPLADLGALLAYWSEPATAPTSAPGFPTRTEVLDLYARKSGRDVSSYAYYLAFAYWRLACIREGVYVRYANGTMGDDAYDWSGYPAAIERLAQQAQDSLGGAC